MTDNERKVYEKIIREVKKHVDDCSITGNKNNWYSGITKNVNVRIKQHEKNKNVMYFKCWDATCFTVARELEIFHSNVGFNNSDLKGNAGKDAKYFYVFKSEIGAFESVLSFFGTTYNDKEPKKVKTIEPKKK